ncbi:hypothetical protein NEOLEDRAFT_579186 [Neolentinus lepideus HHB14362 ss-1]|uniref:Fungal-type protein kinase domain-containing protein n=1 Tax=Neolentinus lepideus HHB14362 ss-1 TaxID=1314782 RepID=A0A165QXT2_9AGAM|nr:hypothetical protein NEOLEDRAFT_579186 [Neolentinus lepideus HHB14362 ss-1]
MNELQKLLFEFREVPDERGRYKPFCSLANKILEKLPQTAGTSEMGLRSPRDKGDRLVFQRSDPMQTHMDIDNYPLSSGSPNVRVPDVIGLALRDALLTTQDQENKFMTEAMDLSKAWKKHAFETALLPPKDASASIKLQVGLEFKTIKSSMEAIPCEFSTELQEVLAQDVMNESREKDGNVKGSRKRKSDTQDGKAAKKVKASNGVKDLVSASDGSHTFSHSSHEKDPVSESLTSKMPPNVQVATYATERLSSSITIDHSLQLIIIDSTIWLWWFDRGGAIQSCGMNFITHLPYFVLLLDILRRFDEHAWGASRVFQKKDSEDVLDVEIHGPGPEPAKVTVTLGALTHLHLHLFRHGTAVVPATSEDPCPISVTKKLSEYEMVAKICDLDEQRENEINILAEVYKVAAEEKEDAKRVRGHVPILLASRDWEDEYAERMQRILGISRSKGKRRFRRLRILLFRRLRPISELSGKEFMKAFRDCFLCHGVLWMSNIYHRDISENNLMYTRVNKVVVGVLNDFDLSIIHSDDLPLASERTGTIPFMAYALLRDFNTGKKVPHIYEYDAESFAYVGLWISARYDNGTIVNHNAYRKWTQPTAADAIAEWKRRALTHCEPATTSHERHFITIQLLARRAVQCIHAAEMRQCGPGVMESEDEARYAQEPVKACFDRLSAIIHGKSLPLEYLEYFEEGDKRFNEWKVTDPLSLWCIRPGLP